MCWIKEGCQSLKPAACSSLPLEVVDHVDEFDAAKLNVHLNKGCYTGGKTLQAQLNNAPASCNPPCFRITKPGEYCYMGTRNNNFSNRRHIGQITVTGKTPAKWLNCVIYVLNPLISWFCLGRLRCNTHWDVGRIKQGNWFLLFCICLSTYLTLITYFALTMNLSEAYFFLKNKAKQNDIMIVSALIFIIVHIK